MTQILTPSEMINDMEEYLLDIWERIDRKFVNLLIFYNKSFVRMFKAKKSLNMVGEVLRFKGSGKTLIKFTHFSFRRQQTA